MLSFPHHLSAKMRNSTISDDQRGSSGRSCGKRDGNRSVTNARSPCLGLHPAPDDGCQVGSRDKKISRQRGTEATSQREDQKKGNDLRGYSGVGEWHRCELLGRGAHGVVYRGVVVATGESIAVKQIQLSGLKKSELKAAENEIHMLRHLEHPNVIRFLGVEQGTEYLNIFLEYLDGGSLRSRLQAEGSMSEEQTADVTRKLLGGLCYLHAQGITHRDIKGANVLLSRDGTVRLADFGTSKRMGSDSVLSGLKGTPHWMAPEVIRGQHTPTGWLKADVWSVGCTVVEMLTGKMPWPDIPNPMAAMFRIAQGESPPLDIEVSAITRSFIAACCCSDPQERYSVKQLLCHPFLHDGLVQDLKQETTASTIEDTRGCFGEETQRCVSAGSRSSCRFPGSSLSRRETSTSRITKTKTSGVPTPESSMAAASIETEKAASRSSSQEGGHSSATGVSVYEGHDEASGSGSCCTHVDRGSVVDMTRKGGEGAVIGDRTSGGIGQAVRKRRDHVDGLVDSRMSIDITRKSETLKQRRRRRRRFSRPALPSTDSVGYEERRRLVPQSSPRARSGQRHEEGRSMERETTVTVVGDIVLPSDAPVSVIPRSEGEKVNSPGRCFVADDSTVSSPAHVSRPVCWSPAEVSSPCADPSSSGGGSLMSDLGSPAVFPGASPIRHSSLRRYTDVGQRISSRSRRHSPGKGQFQESVSTTPKGYELDANALSLGSSCGAQDPFKGQGEKWGVSILENQAPDTEELTDSPGSSAMAPSWIARSPQAESAWNQLMQSTDSPIAVSPVSARRRSVVNPAGGSSGLSACDSEFGGRRGRGRSGSCGNNHCLGYGSPNAVLQAARRDVQRAIMAEGGPDARLTKELVERDRPWVMKSPEKDMGFAGLEVRRRRPHALPVTRMRTKSAGVLGASSNLSPLRDDPEVLEVGKVGMRLVTSAPAMAESISVTSAVPQPHCGRCAGSKDPHSNCSPCEYCKFGRKVGRKGCCECVDYGSASPEKVPEGAETNPSALELYVPRRSRMLSPLRTTRSLLVPMHAPGSPRGSWGMAKPW